MRLSLIYPPISVTERYGIDIGEIGGRQAPLGVLYLAAYSKKQGHEVQVIDAEAERLSINEIVQRLAEFNPDCIGISITTVAWHSSRKLGESIKKSLPDTILLAGGPHITANLEESISAQHFDLGIYGEGELTLAELLDSGFDREKYPEIKGIIYKSTSGKVIKTPERENIGNLDDLPFPDRDSLADIKLYRPPIGCYKEDFVISIITSRGCPYSCVFCDNNTFGRRIRYFSSGYVIKEIETVIQKYKAKEITFVDDTFPSNPVRFKEILETIIHKGLHFKWTCMANLNDINEEIAALMKKTGCWQVAVGIESGNDQVLKTIKKGLTVEKIREKVNILSRQGILVKGFFMMGHPGETLETLRETTRLALDLPLTDVTCTISTPIKGTELYEMAYSGKYGYFDAEADTARLNYWEPVFIPEGLNANTLYQAQRDFFKRFYIRPGILLRQLSKINRPVILKRLLSTLWKIITAPRKKD